MTDEVWVTSHHPNHFRPGEYARIVCEDEREDGRPTWVVEYTDGLTDVWVQDDPQARWIMARKTETGWKPVLG